MRKKCFLIFLANGKVYEYNLAIRVVKIFVRCYKFIGSIVSHQRYFPLQMMVRHAVIRSVCLSSWKLMSIVF